MKKARKFYSIEFKVLPAIISIHCGDIANIIDELNSCKSSPFYLRQELHKK